MKDEHKPYKRRDRTMETKNERDAKTEYQNAKFDIASLLDRIGQELEKTRKIELGTRRGFDRPEAKPD
jgi:hypothetical protein